MAKAKTIATAATQTVDQIPDGTRPEEFLRDADLVGFYERQLDGMDEKDKGRKDVQRKLRSARIGAASVIE